MQGGPLLLKPGIHSVLTWPKALATGNDVRSACDLWKFVNDDLNLSCGFL